MIEAHILEILACPATHRKLHPLGPDKLQLLNNRIASGRAIYVNGDTIVSPLQAALVTDNDTLIYPVEEDIPVLLVERGIAARQLVDP